MKYGYIRVSTKEQNIDRQLSVILKENISMNRIYIDKASGKDFNRKKYKKLVKSSKKVTKYTSNQLIGWEETMMKLSENGI